MDHIVYKYHGRKKNQDKMKLIIGGSSTCYSLPVEKKCKETKKSTLLIYLVNIKKIYSMYSTEKHRT
jgi:hypothetical protein